MFEERPSEETTINMSYSNIPIASAKPLPLLQDDSHRQNDNDTVVVQAHVDENNVFASSNSNDNYYYNYSEPTIAVPASDVMVQPAPKPTQQLAQPPTMTSTTNDNQLQQAIMDPRILALKQRRKRRQAFAAATGFVAGTIVAGPIIGVVAGAVVHGVVKAGGRARQRRIEQRLRQQQEGRGVY